MAAVNIRNIPKEVHARLRIWAARRTRSMEAEARAILSEACAESPDPQPAAALQEWVDQLYEKRKPKNVVEALIAERRREGAEE